MLVDTLENQSKLELLSIATPLDGLHAPIGASVYALVWSVTHEVRV